MVSEFPVGPPPLRRTSGSAGGEIAPV